MKVEGMLIHATDAQLIEALTALAPQIGEVTSYRHDEWSIADFGFGYGADGDQWQIAVERKGADDVEG